MQSWRNPEELLATRAHLPHEINFEYIYDGGAESSANKQIRLLKQELSREQGENQKNKDLIKELSAELELLYQRSVMDGSALEMDYRARCHNYETAIKRLRQELADTKADALKLSRMATDDRRKAVELQGEAQRAAAKYNELCTSAENARLVALREREDLEHKVKVLTELNLKLERRACHAEGEAARAVAENRENMLRWQEERRLMGVRAVARVHHRRRLLHMQRGLQQWRQSAAFERLRAECNARLQALRAQLEEEHRASLQDVRSELEGKLTIESTARGRAELSRDRLAEERAGLVLAARGWGPAGVLRQWRAEMLLARVKRAVERAAMAAERADGLEKELGRVRISFAHMCVRAVGPRLQLRSLRRRFSLWVAQTRRLALLAHEAELARAWQAAEKMASNVHRIRRCASNLVVTVRTRNFIGRAFDCWRIQLEESKLNRIAKFPELWRMSHIADNAGSDSDSDENGSGSGTEEGVVKKQKHRHSGDMGGSVARWGAFETVTGSAEHPEKKVFFKPIIPFFHAQGGGGSSGLSSGRVGVRDVIGTGGAVRADFPAARADEPGRRSMAEFAPVMGLPPQVHFVDTGNGFIRTDPFVVPTGRPISTVAPEPVDGSAAEQPSAAPTEHTAAGDFGTRGDDALMKASEALRQLGGLIPQRAGPQPPAASPREAQAGRRPIEQPTSCGEAESRLGGERETSPGESDSGPRISVPRSRSLECGAAGSGSLSADSRAPSAGMLTRGLSAPFEGRSESASRRSSLTMATASSAIKAASGIAKRRASTTAALGGRAEVGDAARPQGRGSAAGQWKKSASAATDRSAAGVGSNTAPSGRIRGVDIYAPSDDDSSGKHVDAFCHETSSDGSGTPMLVHKVLNSPSYEQWAKRVAKVD